MFSGKCELCPRRCGVNRSAGEVGYCRAGSVPEIFRYGAHHGEEPPISLTRGSGTIFFSRCTMRCLYCQNFPWSQEGSGERYTVEGLAAILRELHRQGCHNWNLVSPTPWLPAIRDAVEIAERDGISLPVVYNTSGFERVETLAQHEDLIDVYLVDLRYSRGESAAAGSDAADYVGMARAALVEMWGQKGPLKLDGQGAAVSGTLCRLLILPGLANEAVENLEWLADHVGTGIAVSVMSQYVPAHKARGRESWGRTITPREYDEVRQAMERLGFTEGWIQDLEGAAPEGLVGYEMKSGPDRT